MAELKFRIKIDHLLTVDSESYRDAYEEKCEEEGTKPEDEVPEDFVATAVNSDFESGELDLAEALEDAAVDVELVK